MRRCFRRGGSGFQDCCALLVAGFRKVQEGSLNIFIVPRLSSNSQAKNANERRSHFHLFETSYAQRPSATSCYSQEIPTFTTISHCYSP